MGRGEALIAGCTSVTFEFRPYQRHFHPPLKTHYGAWRDRSGIILKLTSGNGLVSYGEIAPLPWFGSETLEQAITWCQQLPATLDQTAIFAIPDALPACQFGFESAWVALHKPQSSVPLPMSALLPAGAAAFSAWKPLWQAGYRTFKWKVGVADSDQEWRWFEQLHQALPPEARLRLDANGGLTLTQARQWLERCDRLSVEFLEQPLPPTQLTDMLTLQADYATAIALDESVATLQQLQTCLDQEWHGVVVIKPAIVGSPAQLRRLCQHNAIDAVFSTVFETAIGQQAGLQLAAELGNRDRAVGYGTSHWFQDALEEMNPSFDDLWQHL